MKIVSDTTQAAAQPFSSEKRERLILENLSMVSIIASQIHRRMPPHIRMEDLISAGTIGLINAIDRFDPARNAQLATYANRIVRGAILDSLRRMDWAPRRRRQLVRRIKAATAAVEQSVLRAATEEEVAAQLGVSLDAYRHWQLETQGLDLERLERTERAESSDPREGGRGQKHDRDLLGILRDDRSESPLAACERQELQERLANAIRALREDEQTVLSMSCRDDLTVSEIAKVIDASVPHVKFLKAQAIRKLRVSLSQPPRALRLVETLIGSRLPAGLPGRSSALSMKAQSRTTSFVSTRTAA